MKPVIPTLTPDHKPPVDWNPQPMPVLKERLLHALGTIYNVKKVVEGKVIHPSKLPQHVFDYESVRMVISLDQNGDTDPVLLHISYSLHESGVEDIKTAVAAAGLPQCMTAVMIVLGKRVKASLTELFGQNLNLIESVVTHNYVTHLFFMPPELSTLV